MSLKHYLRMADIFHAALANPMGSPTSRLAILNDVITPFCDFAEQDNPRFDRAIFMAAVDYDGAHNKAVAG